MAHRTYASRKVVPRSRSLGFSLIELLVTVVIVSILASVGLPLAEMAVKRRKEQELHHALREMRDAIDAYKRAVDEGRIATKVGDSGYPPNLVILVNGVRDIKDPSGKMLYFLRRIPSDPLVSFVADRNTNPEQHWGKRSYVSSADHPKEGSDVFDVYSKSEGVGLNGVAYREW